MMMRVVVDAGEGQLWIASWTMDAKGNGFIERNTYLIKNNNLLLLLRI